MKIIIIISITCLSYSSLTFAQGITKIYFIEKIKPDYLFKAPNSYSTDVKFQSVGVMIYKSRNGLREDSTYTLAKGLKTWKDSVAFIIEVPNRFITNFSTLSISPIFHLKRNEIKGGLPNFLLGKEQSISQLKLKIKSDPTGATVYLIPKVYWERNPQLLQYNLDSLSLFLVSEGLTIVTTNVQEYVYIVIFQYKKRFFRVQCSPNHLHTVDSVFTKLN